MPKYKYNWDEWFIKGEFTLRKGIEYHVSQSTMSQIIRNNANLRGLRVSIKDNGDRLLVKVIGVGKYGLPHTDRTTIVTEPTGKLEEDGKNKKEAKGSNILCSTKRKVSKTSIDSNYNKNRAKKTR